MTLYRHLFILLLGWTLFTFGFSGVLILCISWFDGSGAFDLIQACHHWLSLSLKASVALYGFAVAIFIWRLESTTRWSAMRLSGWSKMSVAILVVAVGGLLVGIQAFLHGFSGIEVMSSQIWVEWSNGIVRLSDGAYFVDGEWGAALSETDRANLLSIQNPLYIPFLSLFSIDHIGASIELNRRISSFILCPLIGLCLVRGEFGTHMARRVALYSISWLMLSNFGVAMSKAALFPAFLGPWLGILPFLWEISKLLRRQNSSMINFRHGDEQCTGLTL